MTMEIGLSEDVGPAIAKKMATFAQWRVRRARLSKDFRSGAISDVDAAQILHELRYSGEALKIELIELAREREKHRSRK